MKIHKSLTHQHHNLLEIKIGDAIISNHNKIFCIIQILNYVIDVNKKCIAIIVQTNQNRMLFYYDLSGSEISIAFRNLFPTEKIVPYEYFS